MGEFQNEVKYPSYLFFPLPVNAMKKIYLFPILIVLLILSACASPGDIETPTSAPAELPTALPTATLVPTATALPPVGILLAPTGANPELVDFVIESVTDFVADSGIRFQVLQSLTVDSFERETVQWVVALPPAANLNELVAASAQTRFLTVGIQGLDSAPNLSMIAPDGPRLDHQGFVAGYIAAMITTDWRVGVISIAESIAEGDARNAFLTGVEFYCGMCAPTYPPYIEYPLYVEAAGSAGAAEWQSAADILLSRGVETVYVVPGAGDENLLRYLANSGVKIIGGAVHPEDIADAWVATLDFSPSQAFLDFWPDFVAGQDGQTIDVPLSMIYINDDLLSIGRQRLVREVIADVLAGYIDLGTNPAP
ncbi:MAG: hypothetical protein IMY76_06520 [Chloroflexi bacterium]|nr:hypothetical protein [Chloroflexota bacterium]